MSEANESKPNQGSFDGIEYILGTPLEWSWLEEKLCASLQTKAKFGSDHTAQQIGLGQGSLSVLARIQPMWTQSDERLPRSVIAKIASLKTMREMVNGPLASAQTFLDFNMKEALNSMEKFINSIHNTEASLYAALQTSGLNLKVPKAYVLQKCDIHCPQGVIVMEDMGEDAFTVPLYDVISVENVYEPFLAMIKSMRYLDESLAPMVDRIVDNWDTIFDENT
ncbi:unnamed protein product, partial [Toxocara canis]|uniref:FSA_C domain-containing protein n=1 Tax=Toxocara canis TaxID=6265 RepID=A0A183UKV5_TOXCA